MNFFYPSTCKTILVTVTFCYYQKDNCVINVLNLLQFTNFPKY